MNKKTLPILILFLIVIACIAILVQSLSSPSQAPTTNTNLAPFTANSLPQGQSQPAGASVSAIANPDKLIVITIQAPGGAIKAEVASTSDQQAKGLGDRASLAADYGMLFPFTYPGDYGFWMKDMQFPLDMVWISSNKKVVSITPDISPATYPTVFYPPLAISYVLELNAGAAARFGIATDTQLAF